MLRSNCIDCLDRTNVAQFAYGLAALGEQLHKLEVTEMDAINPRSSLAAQLMDMYEQMGNVLSRQVRHYQPRGHVFLDGYCTLEHLREGVNIL